MVNESAGEEARALALLTYPKGQCGETANGQPRRERIGGNTELDEPLPEGAIALDVRKHGDAPGDIGVTAEVLRHGVDHDVGAVVDGTAQDRRGEGVVHHHDQVG